MSKMVEEDSKFTELEEKMLDLIFEGDSRATVVAVNAAAAKVVALADEAMAALGVLIEEKEINPTAGQSFAALVLMGLGKRLSHWPHDEQLAALKIFSGVMFGTVPTIKHGPPPDETRHPGIRRNTPPRPGRRYSN